MNYDKSRTFGALPALILMTAAWATPTPVRASLGGNVDSVSTDNERARGELHSTLMQSYDRHDITTGPNSVIHEYVSRSGKVFAVSWKGPLPPDLRQLFGQYFEPFRSAAAAQSHPGGHHQLSLAQGDFVFQAVGHQRMFQGKAYVPSLVPAGVSIADLP